MKGSDWEDVKHLFAMAGAFVLFVVSLALGLGLASLIFVRLFRLLGL